MSRLLFVCHRYAPFPGGTEIYVRNMAEEMRERGHDVTVLAATHDPAVLKTGHHNGVRVISDHNVLLTQEWDLIIVHGGDVSSQNVVHNHAQMINQKSPVLYQIIKPSESPICLNGIKHHKYLGWSTEEDRDLITRCGQLSKARYVRHGIRVAESLGTKSADDVFSITQPTVIVSVGGFWPHKGMQELADCVEEVSNEITGASVILKLYGYDCKQYAPRSTYVVHTHFGASRLEVMNAIANADLYVMNSTEEGFGLVLLEAMVNRTPWAARYIAGAKVLQDYGYCYKTYEGLKTILKETIRGRPSRESIEKAYSYVMANHQIRHTGDDIEAVLRETR